MADKPKPSLRAPGFKGEKVTVGMGFKRVHNIGYSSGFGPQEENRRPEKTAQLTLLYFSVMNIAFALSSSVSASSGAIPDNRFIIGLSTGSIFRKCDSEAQQVSITLILLAVMALVRCPHPQWHGSSA